MTVEYVRCNSEDTNTRHKLCVADMCIARDFSTKKMYAVSSGWDVKLIRLNMITADEHLGGHFGPPKKYLYFPPPQFSADTLPAPCPPPVLGKPPPSPGIFSKEPTSSLPGRPGLPLPLPRAEKVKNIRNVHQDMDEKNRGEATKFVNDGH